MRTTVRSRRCGLGIKGMTLIEMLVSITILTVMILAFSSILVQSQRFITAAQASRRSYALAASIARIMRTDMRRVTQNGFLAIATASDKSPLLILTTAGLAHTITDVPGSGTASLVCYGQIENAAPAEEKMAEILWRPSFVLSDDRTMTKIVDKDKLKWGLSYLEMPPETPGAEGPVQGSLREKLNGEVIGSPFDANGIYQIHRERQKSVRIPIDENFANIENLWQVLAHDVDSLSIMWTDGSLDPNNNQDLNWFGINRKRSTEDKEGEIYIRPASETNGAYRDTVEDTKYNQSGMYRALWTQEDQSNWPKALKIRFRIRDKNMPQEFRDSQGLYYEVICNLGQ
jgi:prepilin-type N-terminal cleavage/methylation domain-containing protein